MPPQTVTASLHLRAIVADCQVQSSSIYSRLLTIWWVVFERTARASARMADEDAVDIGRAECRNSRTAHSLSLLRPGCHKVPTITCLQPFQHRVASRSFINFVLSIDYDCPHILAFLSNKLFLHFSSSLSSIRYFCTVNLHQFEWTYNGIKEHTKDGDLFLAFPVLGRIGNPLGPNLETVSKFFTIESTTHACALVPSPHLQLSVLFAHLISAKTYSSVLRAMRRKQAHSQSPTYL